MRWKPLLQKIFFFSLFLLWVAYRAAAKKKKQQEAHLEAKGIGCRFRFFNASFALEAVQYLVTGTHTHTHIQTSPLLFFSNCVNKHRLQLVNYQQKIAALLPLYLFFPQFNNWDIHS